MIKTQQWKDPWGISMNCICPQVCLCYSMAFWSKNEIQLLICQHLSALLVISLNP